MNDLVTVILPLAVCGGIVAMSTLALVHLMRTPPPPPVTVTIDMPKIGDPLTFVGGVLGNVSASPAVTNGLLMILTQELRAIRATMEATTGIAIRPVESAETEPSSATPPNDPDPCGARPLAVKGPTREEFEMARRGDVC